MKQKLRLGDSYALTKHKLRQSKIRYIGLLAVLTTMCLYAVKQASAQQVEPAATAVAAIKPLQIGDTIPSALWHLPLQIVNHPQGKDTVTLNDYRGKLIILDFWATWCGSCIANLPKNGLLNKQYADEIKILPITYEDPPQVAKYTANSYRETTPLETVVADKTLSKIFPHRFIPHYVWIIGDSIFANTDSHEVNSKNISNTLYEGRRIERLKKDESDYNRQEPFLKYPFFINSMIYSSTITRFVRGIGGSAGYFVDEQSGVARTYYTNMNLLSLYKATLQPSLQARILLMTSNRDRFFPDAEASDYESVIWREANHYCFEQIHDIGMEESVRKANMRSDLDRCFQLTSRLAPMEVKCFIIRDTNRQYTPPSISVKSTPLSKLIQHFNEQMGQQGKAVLIINESGKDYLLPLLVENPESHLKLLHQIRASGLVVTEEPRTMEMFIIEDDKSINQ